MKSAVNMSLILGAALLLAACGSSGNPNVYQSGSAQRVSQVDRGEVLQTRPVTLKDKETKWGALAGAGAGGIGGSAIGGDWRANALGAIGGAIVGGLVGSMADDALATGNGYEYIIRKDSGATIAVSQADQTPFEVGQRVLLILGPPARLVADNTVQAAPPPTP